MKNHDDRAAAHVAIVETLGTIQEVPREEIYGSGHLAQLSFDSDKAHKEAIDLVLDLADEVADCELSGLPQNQLTGLNNNLTQVVQLIERAKALTLDHDSPKTERDAIVTAFDNLYQGLHGAVMPVLSYAHRKGTDFKALERKVKNIVNSTEELYNGAKSALAKEKEEANRILVDIKKAAAETGLSKQAVYYKNLQEGFEADRDQWLNKAGKITMGLGASIIGAPIILFNLHKWLNISGSFSFWSAAAASGVILLYLMRRFALKQYDENRMNAETCGYKATALSTFRAISDGATSDPARDIVVTQAASAIFSVPGTRGTNLIGQTPLPTINFAEKALERLTDQHPGGVA